jgi:hypothetical protein
VNITIKFESFNVKHWIRYDSFTGMLEEEDVPVARFSISLPVRSLERDRRDWRIDLIRLHHAHYRNGPCFHCREPG